MNGIDIKGRIKGFFKFNPFNYNTQKKVYPFDVYNGKKYKVDPFISTEVSKEKKEWFKQTIKGKL